MEFNFYDFNDGKNPSLDYLQNLQKWERKLVLKKIDLYEKKGLMRLKSDEIKKFKQYGFHEVIVGDHRFTGKLMGQVFYLVHGFRKKSQKTKEADIKRTQLNIKKLLKEIKK